MTVSTTNAESGPFFGNGATTVFPFTFSAQTFSDVCVLVDGVEFNSELYAVTLTETGGGSITFDTAPANGAAIMILLEPSFTQDTQFIDGVKWKANPVNAAFDRGVLRDQALKRDINRAVSAPIGETLGALPKKEDRAGKFVAFDAEGNPIASAGSGTDTGLRTDLSAPTGSALNGFIQGGAGAANRTAQAKARELVTDTDFTTGLGAALAAVRNNDDNSFSGSAHLPNGLSDITASIVPPQSFARVDGSGGKTIRALAAVNIFDLSGASHSNSSFSNFRTYNGVNVFSASTAGEITTNNYVNLEMSQFTGDAFRNTGGITSSLYSRLKIDSSLGDHGIYSGGGINNDNTIDNVDATNLTDSFVKFLGTTNGLYISNTRVEGNGQAGKAVFDLTAVSGVRIGTGWYEGHHDIFLKLSGASTGAVTIDGIVDIGAKNGGGFKASTFDVGSNIVVFGSNEWSNRTTAPLNCFIYGYNANLYLAASNVWDYKHQRGGKVHLKTRNRAVDGATFDLLTFARAASTPNDFTNQQMITGVLTLQFAGPDGGGVARTISRSYPVQVNAIGTANVTVTVGAAYSIIENAGAVTLTPQAKAGAGATSAVLELVVAGVNAGFASIIDATFEYSNSTNNATNQLTVTPA